eukprot:SAG22_NODE_62_length_23371_cov_84.500602_10_plen_132_part_00
MQLNVIFQDCLSRALSPRGALVLACTLPPAVAVISVLHAIKAIAITDGAFITIQAVFYTFGGMLWTLGYSLALPLLDGDEAKVEATRLLNLATQLGILLGISIGWLVMQGLHSAVHPEAASSGSGSWLGGG